MKTHPQKGSLKRKRKAEETHEEFLSKVRDTLPRDSALRDNRAISKLSDFIDLLGGLPEDDIESFEENLRHLLPTY